MVSLRSFNHVNLWRDTSIIREIKNSNKNITSLVFRVSCLKNKFFFFKMDNMLQEIDIFAE